MFALKHPSGAEETGGCGGVCDTLEPLEFRRVGTRSLRIRVTLESRIEFEAMQQRKPRHTEPLAPDLRAELGALLGRETARGLSRQWGVSRGVLRRAALGEGVTPMAGRYLASRLRGSLTPSPRAA